MSEIEKMYKNCNIKPKQEGYCDWDSDCPYPDIINNGCGEECPYWKYEDKAKYPPFTAEKQLLLLQYIEKLDWIDAVVSFYYMNEEWVFLAQPITEFSNEQMRDFGGKQKEYEQALAQMINTLWQDLTKEERKQIKEILE